MKHNERQRQEDLYAYLAAKDRWVPMKHAAIDLEAVYGWGWGSSGFHNSAVRRKITKDIEAINNSPDFDMIIISGNRGIKLADRGEYEDFVKAELAEIFKKLDRVRKIARKAGLDGQIDLDGQTVRAFEEAGS